MNHDIKTKQLLVDLSNDKTIHKRKLFWLGVWRQYDEQMILWGPWWQNGGNGGNGGRGENCALINLSESGDAGVWADVPCSDTRYYYICERDQ